MGYMFVLGPCIGCQVPFTFHPDFVPSLTVNGTREPVCPGCMARINEIRKEKGLAPFPIHPQAYEAAEG